MAGNILRIEVGCASWVIYRFFVKKFHKYKYRFRILDPSTARSEWGAPSQLRISQADLEYLRYDFPSQDGLKAIGQKLATAIFQGEIHNTLERLIGSTIAKNTNLRLLICCENGIHHLITSVPWECIFYKLKLGQAQEEHLGLSSKVSIARFISRGLDEYQPLDIEDKLVVLGVSSNPSKCEQPLQGKAELIAIEHIAAQRPDLIQFQPLADAGWKEFQQTLAQFRPHVLFFTGHAQFAGKESHLLFQTASGDCDRIPISQLARTLQSHPELRVVILSACETAIAIADHPFATAAHKLIEAGIPAVIAMQSRVVEAAAKAFGLSLFTYLFQEHSIDTCVNAGRFAMIDAEREYKGKGTQWSVPVLYLSTMHDLIFNFGATRETRARRDIMEEKFPRVTKQFIERPRLYNQLAKDFSSDGVTLLRGPFGAGKTQMISSFCTSLIHHPPQRDRGDKELLFFYVKNGNKLATFTELLNELNGQARGLGFEGFLEVLEQLDENNITNGIRHFRELLAVNRMVIVFDGLSSQAGAFWQELFSQLANHLRRSKVYIVTSSDQLSMSGGDYSQIAVGGFEAEEAVKFFEIENRFDAPTVEKMMEVAGSVGYLPWYVRIIRDVFQGKPVESKDTFISALDLELREPERALLQQLSVLRQPVTLQELAVMLDPSDPARYLESAQYLQSSSVLTFTRHLGVELPEQLKEHYSKMTPEEEDLCHWRAAQFYKRRAVYNEPD